MGREVEENWKKVTFQRPWKLRSSTKNQVSWRRKILEYVWFLKQYSCSVVSNFCDPMDCGPPGSPVHGILQARIVEKVAIPFSRSSQPRDQTWISCAAGRFFTVWNTGKVRMVYLFTGNIQINGKFSKVAKSLQLAESMWKHVCSGNSVICYISRRQCAFHFGEFTIDLNVSCK